MMLAHAEEIIPSSAMSCDTPAHQPVDALLLLKLIAWLLPRVRLTAVDVPVIGHEALSEHRARATGGLAPKCLQRVLNHIDANLGGEICPRELAKIAKVSEYHFIRCFKQSTGLPPHRYIMRQRVMRAKTLLLETSNSVVNIALTCGFADQSHMSTHFRRVMGTTPGQYRRENS